MPIRIHITCSTDKITYNKRFGDREPTVRHEVWAAFTSLLRQTRQFTDTTQADAQTQDLQQTLQPLVPKLLKPLLKTLSPKSAPPTPALNLLDALLNMPCSLAPFEPQLFKILVQPEALPTFTHMINNAVPDSSIEPKLINLMHERHPRVAADALRASISLLQHQSSPSASLGSALQKESRERLRSANTDASVREAAADAIGALLVAGFEYDAEDWEMVRRAGAVRVVVKTIEGKGEDGKFEKDWIEANIVWCVDLVRRGTGGGGKAGKVEAMECLQTLLAKQYVPLLVPLSHLPNLSLVETEKLAPICKTP